MFTDILQCAAYLYLIGIAINLGYITNGLWTVKFSKDMNLRKEIRIIFKMIPVWLWVLSVLSSWFMAYTCIKETLKD